MRPRPPSPLFVGLLLCLSAAMAVAAGFVGVPNLWQLSTLIGYHTECLPLAVSPHWFVTILVCRSATQSRTAGHGP